MPPTEQHNHTVYQEIDNITHKFYLALLHIQHLSRTIRTMDHHHIVIRNTFHWLGDGPRKDGYSHHQNNYILHKHLYIIIRIAVLFHYPHEIPFLKYPV